MVSNDYQQLRSSGSSCLKVDMPLQRSPYAHRKALSPTHALRTRGCQAGRTVDQHLEVRHHSSKVQHAHAKQQGPNISLLAPVLQKQWDHTANAALGDIDIKPYSNRKVYWICDQCPDGHAHSWSAPVANRTKGSGCPLCRGRTVCKHNSLATKAPSVAAEWDYEANSGTPNDVTAQSGQIVYWRCACCGCKWITSPHVRVRKQRSGCPQCAEDARTTRNKQPTFAECRHPLLAEWDHQQNKIQGNSPANTTLKSNKQIFWLCTKCPAGQQHSWAAPPHRRARRSKPGCPFCAGQAACKCNSLQALYPDVAAEWDCSKNTGQPCDYTARSHKVVWWCTPQCGSWPQTICSRTDPRLSCHRKSLPASPEVLGSC
ncbi:hypothetical protein ABBQ32_006419 [Trebouxia sp. C0010 RCD-2024]